MTAEVLTLSRKELDRPEVIRRVVSKRLRQKEAACQLASGIHRIEQKRTLEIARICNPHPSLSPQDREIHRCNAEMLHRQLLQSEEDARILSE